MGATNFSDIQLVKGDLKEAYRQANEEARDYNGHQDGYSGDIQTCHGVRDYTSSAPRYGTKAFQKWEDDMLDNHLQKWEHAAAVEIKGTMLRKLKEREGLKGRKGYRAFYFFGWGAE